jgi:DivIVA domain-containing protein
VPLTPEDVSNKRFATARLFREGYDMTEVDQFLDEIEAELRRLLEENRELRGTQQGQSAPSPVPESKPEKGSGGDAGSTQDEAAAQEPSSAGTPATTPAETPAKTPAKAPAETPAETPAEPAARVAGGPATLEVTTTQEASAAVARMLEIAGRNADELLAEAKGQADKIVSEATGRAERLDAETEERRSKIVADLERDHQVLTTEVEDLRAFEREYRAQLRNYFQQQLDALDAQGGGVTLAEDLHEDEGEIGSRLRSILESEEQEPSSDDASQPSPADESPSGESRPES